MSGFDTARPRSAIALPERLAIQIIVAIGKPGDRKVLPEGLQARETPNGRLPLSQLASEGWFAAAA